MIDQAAVTQRALRVLKQKKTYEAQIDQLQQQTFNMEQATMTTENLRNTMATMEAMKIANKEMKKQYGKVDLEKIEVCSFLLLSCERFAVHGRLSADFPHLSVPITDDELRWIR